MFKPISPFFWFTISFKAKVPIRVELSYNKLVMSILQGQIHTHDCICICGYYIFQCSVMLHANKHQHVPSQSHARLQHMDVQMKYHNLQLLVNKTFYGSCQY